MDIAVSVSSNLRDELCTRLIQVVSQLISEAEDVAVEKESFLMFSMYVKQMKTIIEELHGKAVEGRIESVAMKTALQELELDVNKALNVIRSYKSRGRFSLLMNSGSLLSNMKQAAHEIARDVTLLSLANLDMTLELKSKTNGIVNGFQTMEFKSAAATEAIILEIEKCNAATNARSRENLLKQIADAVGATPNISLVRSEIQLLRQEKDELELRKQRAEALQLSQLIHLLQSLDTPPPSPPSETLAGLQNNLISSFVCPLSGEQMEDPVAICCGHSFERKAISDYFQQGETSCPECKEELSSLELTANISLRSSILEWKNRNMNLRLQKAIAAFDCIEYDVLNQALEDLQELIGIPECMAEVSRKGLVSKLVDLMKCGSMNTKAALKCLRCLANHSRENKEVIASKGAIRWMIKQFYRGEIEADALELLVRLSDEEMIAERIGDTKDAIPTLVSLVQYPNPEISQKAQIVLRNLPSSNTRFVVEMAEAGHFDPFLAQFHQVRSATRCLMATALTKIQLSESAADKFETEDFIRALTKMLYSNSSDCKSSCLLCMKKLVMFHRLARRFLSERDTIPSLLGLMYSSISENHWKREATDILISLVRVSEPTDYSTNIGLQELHSQHNIDALLNLTATSTPHTMAALLRFLLAMVQKSEVARDSIHSDQIATICSCSVVSEGKLQGEVRLQALKLIHFVAKNKPSGIQLPQSPHKESIVTSLVTILTSSRSIEERSAAAGIIGHLPVDDPALDEILCRSEALRPILDVIISLADAKHAEMMPKEPILIPIEHGLLENALAGLLRYTDPAKPELWKQVSKFEVYPSLVHVLSTGSSVAKQQTAQALTNLCRCTHHSSAAATTVEQITTLASFRLLTEFLNDNNSWCCLFSPSLHQSLCPIHGSACSSRHTFCLINANAVKPLLQMLSETQSGAPEAALMALDTLFMDSRTFSNAAKAIADDNQGIAAILHVMEKGLPPAKEKALDLFKKIFPHCTLTTPQFKRLERILIHLLQFDSLKSKAASMLAQMGVIQQQSSYF